jgi:succinate-semialdehyde dehydrogenase / glutarate-semialdehyde dehydrogenase
MTLEAITVPLADGGRLRDRAYVAGQPYGLAGYFYSRDVGRIFRVSEQLEYGILGINTGFISVEVAPFGGVKESGIGRESSKYGVDDWIETRYLSLGGIER